MPYRTSYRSNAWNSNPRYSGKVIVNIIWDQLTNVAYKVKFDNIGPYFKSKVEPMVNYIKATVPVSDREYDPDTKTWYISEKYITNLKEVFEQVPEFEVNFHEKPDLGGYQATFHSKEADFTTFCSLLNSVNIPCDNTTSDLATATKLYRKAMFALHPDRYPEKADDASRLNEVWGRLKGVYFK